VERIQKLLEEGQLNPGARLPPERELAQLLSVSRSSLREALKALALMGVLESRVADGTYVRTSAVSGLADSLQFSILLRSKTSFMELIEARMVLEPELVRLATPKITEDQLARLEYELEILSSLVQSTENFNEHDTMFHLLIAEGADNQILYGFARVLQRMAVVSRAKTAYRYNLAKTCAEHGDIVKQMRARNVDGARQAMIAHLEGVKSVTLASDIVELATPSPEAPKTALSKVAGRDRRHE